MSEVRDKNFKYIIKEEEPPVKKLISEADILIKRLSEKQRNTVINLQEQLNKEKEFIKATELIPLSSFKPGASSLIQFQGVAKHFEQVENLKAAGLLDDDINLYLDSLKGYNFLLEKHKNYESSSLQQRLIEIEEKIHRHEETSRKKCIKALEKHEVIEYGLSIKPDSIETKLLKFARDNERGKIKTLPHPMDDIKQIESSLFANVNQPVSLAKIRRKARKLSKRIDNISELKFIVKTCSPTRRSKWDVKELTTEDKPPVTSKTYSCSSRNIYTIKQGEIVKLAENKAELEGLKMEKRFTEEEIRRVPKFEDYKIGLASKILYIKNLSKSIKESELQYLFRNYTCKCLDFRIMSGRMRGQAFVTFPDENTASQALYEVNGTVINNRPVIIQFGNRNATN